MSRQSKDEMDPASPPAGAGASSLRRGLVATSVRMTLLLMFGTGIIYPLVMTGVAQVLFRDRANGSLVENAQGRVVGSRLIGQQFSGARYFHPRLSAAGTGYDASASGGTNLGPTSRTLLRRTVAQANLIRRENGLPATYPLPADAVSASASGLDPDISPAYAELQVRRVARARHLSEASVRALVQASTSGRTLGVLGEPRVNVLELNLALDRRGT